MDDSDTTVRDTGSRYLIAIGATDAGFLEYLDQGPRRVFLHTEVSPEFGGRGLAGQLVRAALDDVRAQGKRLVNFCPYVAGFLEKNHEWDELIDRPTPAVLEAVRAYSDR
ncbi:GNAT family N-acetyltransferase [Gryllotalpicola protaetiae]|uniref:N-acetyltransferase n=1 Tax=Gryllotalpicola protaetiae TaxID=2419771 RepID=A0A387BRE3_9MICO|nr:GNAT family N-acetyltransferase [Gryllotalpicola protaetiae]AYG03629.1 N-acetyltransferase [Gryllotalpicola protaetiae]